MEYSIPWRWQMVEFGIANVTLSVHLNIFWACLIVNDYIVSSWPVHDTAETRIWKAIYMQVYISVLLLYSYKMGSSGCFLEGLEYEMSLKEKE